MRVTVDPAWWTSAFWEGHPVAELLDRRDVSGIFRFLHARGLSYGVIGGLVGISPNRTAEIAKRVREVTAYDVLERIAVGLRIPRGAMGLGRDPVGSGQRSPATGREPGADGDVSTRGHLPHPPDTSAAGLTQLRSQLDEALASASVSPRQLDLIEESAAEHVRVYPANPPDLMLSRMATECTEVLTLSRRRQPAAVQARLSGIAALLATLFADALMRLGSVADARLWYRTAVLAADDSTQMRLRVLVRAQAAMLPFYFGDPRETVSLTEQALALSGTAFPSSALAAAARARALARIGAADAARQAIRQAQELFDEAGDADGDAAFRFPAKRLLFYLSGARSWLGDTTDAYRLQDEALRLYQSSSPGSIDPVLIKLDRSMCLAHDRRVAEASDTAREAIAALPEPQRTEIVLVRAQDVVTASQKGGRRREVAELADWVEACRERTGAPPARTAALHA